MCQTFMKKKKWKTSVVNYPNSKQWNRLTNIRIRLLIRSERQNGELAVPSNRNAFLPISKRQNGELAVPTSRNAFLPISKRQNGELAVPSTRNAIFPLHVEEINQFTIVQSEASLDEVKKAVANLYQGRFFLCIPSNLKLNSKADSKSIQIPFAQCIVSPTHRLCRMELNWLLPHHWNYPNWTWPTPQSWWSGSSRIFQLTPQRTPPCTALGPPKTI